ncbi:lectin BRA-3-like [Ostrea edulis]|uniref:lectin BRA-3-like n=1 Tax=Ostrea edulis TaxID=37623 RepID=UPI0020949C68|nr:lectin BRA-3-like [Ostrea edulis]
MFHFSFSYSKYILYKPPFQSSESTVPTNAASGYRELTEEKMKMFVLLLSVCILGMTNSVSGAEWLRYNKHWYYHSTQKLNWMGAQLYCRRQGGNLVHIDNAQENNWLSSKYTAVSTWIGITDQAVEGVWRSVTTGERVPYINWGGPPDNYKGNQHCGTLNYGGRGRWDDDTCSKKRTFICEVSGY